jgi:hypothetical protein
MKTIEQKNINLEAPENNVVKLSMEAVKHLIKVDVDNVLNEINKKSLEEFANNERNTLLL